jgi:hypothetical protein
MTATAHPLDSNVMMAQIAAANPNIAIATLRTLGA